jgi:hypothetical protein
MKTIAILIVSIFAASNAFAANKVCKPFGQDRYACEPQNPNGPSYSNDKKK